MEKLNIPQIENMQSRNGNYIANQFIIWTDDATYFQSYKSIIVMKKGGQITLDENKWNYSVTTGKYRNQFLGEDKKETEKKIKSGIYQLTDLNK